MEFKITGSKGQTEWLNADEWSVGEIENITSVYSDLFGDDWHLEFK